MKLAEEDIDGCEGGVETHGCDGGEEETSVLVGEPGYQFAGNLRFRSPGIEGVETDSAVGFPQTNGAEDLGEVAFFTSGVDETAGGEGRGVQGAETRA